MEKDDRKEERCLPISQSKVPPSFSLLNYSAVPIRKAIYSSTPLTICLYSQLTIVNAYTPLTFDYKEKKYKEKMEKSENVTLLRTVFNTYG